MIRSILVAAMAALTWASAAGAAEPTKAPRQLAQSCDPTFGGKYGVLLRRLRIPSDRGQYGACRDYGSWSGTSYKGHTNLPPGAYWTYSYPYWYVWARRRGSSFSYGACGDLRRQVQRHAAPAAHPGRPGPVRQLPRLRPLVGQLLSRLHQPAERLLGILLPLLDHLGAPQLAAARR